MVWVTVKRKLFVFTYNCSAKKVGTHDGFTKGWLTIKIKHISYNGVGKM